MNKNDEKVGAVLVVGGGIGGIQASLDLADSGFKVYLVDKQPSIGGVMAQLDKTFPTNDCAMCILAPKLVAAGRHPNIELVTYAEVEEVTGEAGNFNVKVKKLPRYVDGEKCTGCGTCWANCPVRYQIYRKPKEKIEVKLEPEEVEKVKKIIDHYKGKESVLLPVLHDINITYSYLPEKVLRYISEELDLPLSLVYRVGSFYNAFSFKPRGRHTVSVCLGTACYIKGGGEILESFQKHLGIKVGETTEDLSFGLETISCFGCCGQAPVVVVNEELYGHFRATKAPALIERYREVKDGQTES
jgi:NADH:ubiquinone oxidoreductase subunit E